MIDAKTIAAWVQDSRQRTRELLAGLTAEQLRGPKLRIVNPPLWEVGHLGWFQERWLLRRQGQPSLRDDADSLYDSAGVPHDSRWDLAMPSLAGTLHYLDEVQEQVLDRLTDKPSSEDLYFALLATFHEDMHGEAFLYTRQTFGYAAPKLTHTGEAASAGSGGLLPGDVVIPGGTFMLGATPDEPFVFDNEKWAHPVVVKPFAMARAPVTQVEFAGFVEGGGYRRPEFWSRAGWTWRQTQEAEGPAYWFRDGTSWLRRDFNRYLPLEPYRPVIHVNWYEADAYCRWAKRRLPTEAEWEYAASHNPAGKRRFPWGDSFPTPDLANLGARAMGCIDVAGLPEGDSPAGCRQMIGNVWEWCGDDFLPYPGFVIDPYKEYSKPWFGNHKVLRGGCWVTQPRLLRNTWRNFYTPDRRDVWAGFRTCAASRP